MADVIDELAKQFETPPKKHSEYSVEQIISDVLDATENGQVCVAMAFLNGMLAALKLGGNK